jgi:hypothetical protein
MQKLFASRERCGYGDSYNAAGLDISGLNGFCGAKMADHPGAPWCRSCSDVCGTVVANDGTGFGY